MLSLFEGKEKPQETSYFNKGCFTNRRHWLFMALHILSYFIPFIILNLWYFKKSSAFMLSFRISL